MPKKRTTIRAGDIVRINTWNYSIINDEDMETKYVGKSFPVVRKFKTRRRHSRLTGIMLLKLNTGGYNYIDIPQDWCTLPSEEIEDLFTQISKTVDKIIKKEQKE